MMDKYQENEARKAVRSDKYLWSKPLSCFVHDPRRQSTYKHHRMATWITECTRKQDSGKVAQQTRFPSVQKLHLICVLLQVFLDGENYTQ